MKNSIKSTYDSRQTGDQYWVTTAINNRVLEDGFRRRIPDPFVRTTVTVGWREILRAMFLGRKLIVEVTVGAETGVMYDVLELDENTLIAGRTRKAAFQQSMHDKLASFVDGDPS